MALPQLLLIIALAPLAGALVAGLFGTQFFGAVLGRRAAHSVAILGVGVSFIVSCMVAQQVAAAGPRSTTTRSIRGRWPTASSSTSASWSTT